ncbi:hypothetical protein X801_05155, partial [Opisthorchis viverrini]
KPQCTQLFPRHVVWYWALVYGSIACTQSGVFQTFLFTLSACAENISGNAYGPIQIGHQQFRVMFDTGGFTRWLPSSRSAPHLFSRRIKYDKNSPTRISLEREYRTSYSGERYRGNVVMDTVSIAGNPIEQFAFVEMIYSSISVDTSEGFDGIIGMRKPQGDHKRGDIFKITLTDHLLATGSIAEGIFTFRFC